MFGTTIGGEGNCQKSWHHKGMQVIRDVCKRAKYASERRCMQVSEMYASERRYMQVSEGICKRARYASERKYMQVIDTGELARVNGQTEDARTNQGKYQAGYVPRNQCI